MTSGRIVPIISQSSAILARFGEAGRAVADSVNKLSTISGTRGKA